MDFRIFSTHSFSPARMVKDFEALQSVEILASIREVSAEGYILPYTYFVRISV